MQTSGRAQEGKFIFWHTSMTQSVEDFFGSLAVGKQPGIDRSRLQGRLDALLIPLATAGDNDITLASDQARKIQRVQNAVGIGKVGQAKQRIDDSDGEVHYPGQGGEGMSHGVAAEDDNLTTVPFHPLALFDIG